MTSDVLMITIVISLLSLVVGYLIASMKSNKAIVESSHSLDAHKLNAEQLQRKLEALEKTHTETVELLNNTGMKNKEFSTMLISQNNLAKDLEARLNVAEEKANKAIEEKHSAEKQNESAQTELRQFKELQNKFETLQEQNKSLLSEHAELTTSLSEREKNHQKLLAQIEEQKKMLGEHFKSMANDILDAKAKSLQESSKLGITALMNPFQESMNSFKKEVQEIHHRETTQQGELKKELETLKDLNQQITKEAHDLSTALKGQKKLQGNWGELVLENVLDRSGLQLGKDYQREVSFTTEEGRKRPDAVVYLPQDKHLIIDAKVSLNAYTRFVNGEDEQERAVALNEHVKAMGDRIQELADRDYCRLPGMNSPEMVFMFVPIESAFVEALKADESLFQTAIENNVLVATPTTLLTSLNIVRQLWRYEDQNKHTAALANKAESVFKKLNTFLASFEGIKKGLEKASESYVKAEGQLVSGKGNLVKQVGEFKNLAPSIKAELPNYFVDKADLEADFIPTEDQLQDQNESVLALSDSGSETEPNIN